MSHDEVQMTQLMISPARVRQNAFGAGFAAALMLFFSFANGGWDEPTGGGAFELGGKVWIATIKYGGFAMLVSAILSVSGTPFAILFDGVGSLIVGGLMALAAVLMLIGGGAMMESVLYTLLGIFFFNSGLRNMRMWMHAATATREVDVAQSKFDEPVVNNSKQSLAPPVANVQPSVEQPVMPDMSVEPNSIKSPNHTEVEEPAPEGFLAAFAPDSKKDNAGE